MIIDAKNAYFHAEEDELVAVDPPEEWLEEWVATGGDPRVMWKLLRQLYGRRKASKKFSEYVANIMRDIGMVQCEFLPQFYFHSEKKVYVELHHDDSHITADPNQLIWFRDNTNLNLMIKASVPIGIGHRYAHLKRQRLRMEKGTFIRMPEKHVEKMKKELGMEGCRAAATPVMHEDAVDDTDELDYKQKKKYSTVNGIVQFITRFRPDAHYTIKEIGRNAHKPTEAPMKKVRRCVRYLSGTPEVGMRFPTNDGKIDKMIILSDSDWAKDRQFRKSTSCGVIVINDCLMYSYSRTQTVVALSSGAAEWYAKVAVFIEALLIHRLFGFSEIEIKMELFGDASAARGMSNRPGVGRVKHLEIKTLWLQQFTTGKRGEESVQDRAINTKKNGADIGTKAHSEARLRELMTLIGMKTIANGNAKEVTEIPLMKDFQGVKHFNSDVGQIVGDFVCKDARVWELVSALARAVAAGASRE